MTDTEVEQGKQYALELGTRMLREHVIAMAEAAGVKLPTDPKALSAVFEKMAAFERARAKE